MAQSLETGELERYCRLCAEEQEVTIMIFSDEAKAMLLHKKLDKYLFIKIDKNDKLPKNICVQCCSKLQTVCDFIDSVHKAQEVLLNRSQLFNSSTAVSGLPIIQPGSIKTEICDEEGKITGMEVNVDPMMVLQNENMLSPNTDTCDNAIDVTYLHGVTCEDVTIKLIRKRNTPSPTMETVKEENKKPFACKICQRSFCTELALKNHSWIHVNEDKVMHEFFCNNCQKSFENKNDLITHLRDHRKIGFCRICGRTSEKNLKSHMSVHLTSAVAYTCKVCGRSYNTRSNLRNHSVTHSNDRPYKCHICKKGFKRKQDLKFHINQHTGAKPYKCPFCDKCFASSGNCYSHRSRMHPGRDVVNKHRNIHLMKDNQLFDQRGKPKLPLIQTNGKGIYKCQFCCHSFMKRDNYIYHMYQHTGEKPYTCTFCPEKFVTRRGLLFHHNKEHPNKDRPLALLSKNALLK